MNSQTTGDIDSKTSTTSKICWTKYSILQALIKEFPAQVRHIKIDLQAEPDKLNHCLWAQNVTYVA